MDKSRGNKNAGAETNRSIEVQEIRGSSKPTNWVTRRGEITVWTEICKLSIRDHLTLKRGQESYRNCRGTRSCGNLFTINGNEHARFVVNR